MAAKFFAVLLLSAVISQGYAITEIWLPDDTTTYVTNPLIHKSIGISKWWFDDLISCDVIYPNGVMYQAYPNNNLLHDAIEYMTAVPPFNGCSIAFRHPGIELSGTYELLSLVRHNDDSITLTRKRFHLTFVTADIWQRDGQPAEAESQPEAPSTM